MSFEVFQGGHNGSCFGYWNRTILCEHINYLMCWKDGNISQIRNMYFISKHLPDGLDLVAETSLLMDEMDILSSLSLVSSFELV